MASLTASPSKPMVKNDSSFIQVAQIGRLVGVRGELKLHLHCDFPEQFCKGKTFITDKGIHLEIATYSSTKGLVAFCGYQTRESAAVLVNQWLCTTVEASLKECALQEGEFFWFDLIDALIIDEGMVLGHVSEIERIGSTDYLVVTTDAALVQAGLAKQFYLPYIGRYILSFSKEAKQVITRDVLGIVEQS